MMNKGGINSFLSVITVILAAASIVMLVLIYTGMPRSPESSLVNDAKIMAGEMADNNLPEAAIEEYKKILDKASLTPGERGAICYLIGRVYFEDVGDYERAAAYYIRARSLDKDASYFAEAGVNLITCLEKMGRRLDARRELDRQSSAQPDTGRVAGKLVAKVGSQDITLAEFNDAFQNLSPQIQDEFSGTEGRKNFLNQMIGRELIYHAALREGLDRDSRLQKDLKDIERDYLIQYYTQQKIVPTIKPDTADLNLYYQANKEKFGGKALADVHEEVMTEYIRYIGQKAINDYVGTLIKAEPVQTFEENLK